MIVQKLVCEKCGKEEAIEQGDIKKWVSVSIVFPGKPKDFCSKECAREYILDANQENELRELRKSQERERKKQSPNLQLVK